MRDPQQYSLKSVTAQKFKSIRESIHVPRLPSGMLGVVGANGAGKSVLLEAIAFACGASNSQLRIDKLDELVRAGDVPRVELEFVNGAGKVLKVACTITDGGVRAYHMAGKKQSLRAVQRRLAAERLWGTLTFIRQSQVAHLVERCTPEDLSDVVSAASRLDLFLRAQTEATKCRGWLASQTAKIRGSLESLKLTVAGNSRRVQAERRGHEALRAAERAAADSVSALAALRRALAARRVELAARCAALEAQEAQAEARMRDRSADAPDPAPLRELEERLRAAQAALQEKQAHCEQVAEAAGLAARLQGAARDAAASAAALERTLEAQQALLTAKQAALQRAEALLAEGSERRSAVSSHAELQIELQQAEASLHQLERARRDASHKASASEQELRAAQEAMKGVDSSSLRGQLAALEARHRTAQAGVHTCQRRVDAARADVAAVQDSLSALGVPLDVENATPLLAAFRFRPGKGAEVLQCAAALAVMLQALLEVLVVADVQSASRLLESRRLAHRSLRVWPLDTIHWSDPTGRHERIIRAFPRGALISALDLCDCADGMRPAVCRALGSMLIAVDDQVASDATKRFGMPCVTLQGRKHSVGVLEGGWRGDSSQSDLITRKLHLDECTQRCAAAAEALSVATRSAAAVAASVATARSALEAAEQRGEALASARASAAQLSAERDRAQAMADAQMQHVSQLRQQQAAVERIVAGVAGGDDGSASALESVVVDGRDTVRTLTDAVESARRAGQAAREAQRDAEAELRALADSGVAEELEDVQAEVRAREAEARSVQDELELMRARHAAHAHDLQELQQARAAAQAARDGQQAAVQEREQLARESEEAGACMAGLRRDAGLPAEGSAADDADAAAGEPDVDDGGALDLDALRRRCRCAHDDAVAAIRAAGRHKHAFVDASDRQLFARHELEVQTAEERLSTLLGAADVLEGEVARSSAAVVAYNDAIFARTAALFAATLAEALPDMDFEARSVGEHAHQGVAIRFRKKDAQAAPWSAALGELSGGQRTLCALAFLMAAAQAGHAPALLLVDEVDAALDDVNQQRAGALLQAVSRSTGCQMLAISHSAAFQRACSHHLKVRRDEAGTAVELVRSLGGQRLLDAP